ncbi:hypothetical protein [Tumebacillus permanentifrigoris]|uniref:Uncharacterized protein n=1 Tax=Tumebacillus permanentifrigoris TaxID=378543 RepID=A0A316D8S2_9BACL|nr:hypothetical protein [Tumebacillus permanentifrigoris]PWK11599.1 hypothetical protein C7459_110128 [Tumebacillus permanentifrigoris]
MEKPFSYPLTMKNGKVFDAAGKDVTDLYQEYKQSEAADKMVAALEKLSAIKAEGHETRRMLFIDSAYKYASVIETFVGDDLSDRLNLAYAGKVEQNEAGEWLLNKMNRKIVPIESLASLYGYVSRGDISMEMAEIAWDNREAIFYMIRR